MLNVNKSKRLAAGIMAISSVLFAALCGFIYSKTTNGFDETILKFFSGHNETLTNLVLFFTEFAGTKGFLIFCIILTIVLIFKKKYGLLLVSLFSIGGATLISTVLKDLIARPRPVLWEHLSPETSFSFPSTHATVSSVVVIVVVFLLWNTKFRKLAIAMGVIYAVGIACTRWYIGVHYPTDIFGGWLLSTFWTSFVLYLWFSYKERLKIIDDMESKTIKQLK